MPPEPQPIPEELSTVSPTRALVVVLALAAAVYAPTLGHEFQFDDAFKIVENPTLLDPMYFVSALGRGEYSESVGRFLPNMTFVLNRAALGLEPFGYHLTNLLLHLVNVCLVALLGTAVLRRLGAPSAVVPLLAAGLFAVHPLNSEAVNYLNARPNLMVTTFYLTTLWCALWATEPDIGGRGRAALRWLACLVSVSGALLSKELGITIVAMVPIMLLWLAEPFSFRRWLVPAVGLSLLGVGVFWSTGILTTVFYHLVPSGDLREGSWVFDLLAILLSQAEVFLRYVGLGLAPLPIWLNVDRATMGLPSDRLFPGAGAIDVSWSALVVPVSSAVVLAASLVAIWRLRRRYPFPTLWGMWLFVTHAPTSLIPRAEPMVEYRTYLPMVGFCLLAAWLLSRLGSAIAVAGGRYGSPGVRRFAALGLLALLAFLTSWRNQAWMTEESLWLDSLSKAPDNARAYNTLGKVALDRGDLLVAEAQFRRALTIDPGYGDAYGNLGSALAQQGDDAGALDILLDGASYAPSNPEIQNNLANVLTMQGDYARATEHYDEAIELDPLFAKAHANRGTLRLLQGDPPRAVADLQRAVALSPEMAVAHLSLGDALVALDRLDAGVDSYGRALELEPRDTRALIRLASAYGRLGEPRLAREALERVLVIEPTNRVAAERLAEVADR